MIYRPPTRYTASQLSEACRRDLLNDAETAERQAEQGPFYPERGITKESLLAYAAECREKRRLAPDSSSNAEVRPVFKCSTASSRKLSLPVSDK